MRPSILFKLPFALLVLAIPLAGVWLASSLVAAAGGPPWLAVAGGSLAFPVLPVVWEWIAGRRETGATSTRTFLRDIDRPRAAALGWFDRVVLRTLALNVLFLAVLFGFARRPVGLAVAERGDWFLDGVHGQWVDGARAALLAAADRVTGVLTVAADPNPYVDLGAAPTVAPPPPPPPTRAAVTLQLPTGARARIDGWFPPEELVGTEVRDLPLGAGSLRVDFDDGLRLVCPFHAAGDVTLALEPGWALGGTACLQLRPPDPTWRPDLYLLDRRRSNMTDLARQHAPPGVFADDRQLEQWLRDQRWLDADQRLLWSRASGSTERIEAHLVGALPVVVAAEVTAVQIREPFTRVLLTEAGGKALCDATRASPWARVALVVDGAVVGIAPEDAQEQCTGAVSVPVAEADRAHVTPEAGPGVSPWPMPSTPMSLAALPAEDQDAIASVGRWIASTADNPFDRVKLVHDYVVDRLSYDHSSVGTGHRAPQDADTVFRTRTGVCAGYANLMVSLGRAAGLEVVYLTGLARDGGSGGGPHAWNAVRIGDGWFLIDATWDDGERPEDYETGYLLTPPEIFVLSHLPKDPAWQLLPTEVSRGDFVRQPWLNPSFFADELRLVSPDRSQVTVDGDLELRIDNPAQVDVQVEFGPRGTRTRCKVQPGRQTVATCPIPTGLTEVLVFHRRAGGPFAFGGRVEAIRR